MMLDKIDRAILAATQKNGRASTDRIAESVNLSPSAVQRRLARLRQEGVIVADTTLVSPAAAGKEFIAYVHVTLEADRPDVVRTFRQAMQACPEVLLLSYVKTDVDYVLLVALEDAAAFRAFAERQFSESAHVRRFSTVPVLENLKWGLTLDLREPSREPT